MKTGHVTGQPLKGCILGFKRLKNDVADISLAEQRIAALIRLSFDNKQMAAILGISSDSVAKSKGVCATG